MKAAYGVRFEDRDGPAHWPLWKVEVSVEPADDAEGMSVWPDAARIGVPGVGELRLDRPARRITFAGRRRPSPEALAHPGLAPAAVVIAHWAGRASLHAAAVVAGGGVWGLLGERAGGKSTTAALLCGRGCTPFTDDVLITTSSDAFAGPPSIDLRSEPAAALGGMPLAHRDRWRQEVSRPVLEAPLAGFVALEWGDRTDMTSVGGSERLVRLNSQIVLGGLDGTVLDLATLPMLLVRRPRDFGSAPECADAIIDAIAEEARVPGR